MYDIAQLNDMLVPELKDIADQLSIPHAQKTDKQDLIYKILDRQAVAESATKTAAPTRRKRIAKNNTNTTNGKEQSDVITAPEPAPEPQPQRQKGAVRARALRMITNRSWCFNLKLRRSGQRKKNPMKLKIKTPKTTP
jgi:Rho termination factor, N-terminal domain